MTRKKAKQNSEQFIDEMAATIKAAPALLTHEQIELAERAFQSHGYARRVALVSLTKSGQELIDAVCTNREFAVAMADSKIAAAVNRAESWGQSGDRVGTRARSAALRLEVRGSCGGARHGVVQVAGPSGRNPNRGALTAVFRQGWPLWVMQRVRWQRNAWVRLAAARTSWDNARENYPTSP
jgi:hypothetical protein